MESKRISRLNRLAAIALNGLTIKHRIRLFIGITGQMHDGSYCFGRCPEWVPFKLARMFYKFMFYVGNPVLNKIIGYKEDDWFKK